MYGKVMSALLVCGLLLLGAQFAEPQSVGGIPSRLRIRSLGVNVAAPATAGDVAIGGACTVAGSRCNTVANAGRVAYGAVSAGGVLSDSLNVNSVTSYAGGTGVINITAAGFTAKPTCVCSGVNASQSICVARNATTTTTSLEVVTSFESAGTFGLSNTGFQFVCHGI